MRPREGIAKHAIAAPPDQRDFLALGSNDLQQLRRELQPLARKLAVKLERRRRQHRGAIDVRRTLRRSMATGGVPVDPAFQARRRHRPDLLLVADMSGSVGGFSGFTMLLMKALATQFRTVRMLGFVSSVADITDAVDRSPATGVTAWALGTPELTRRGRSSAYGNSLQDVVTDFADLLTPRTTVLVLGDARTNFGDPNLDALREIDRRSRGVTWLNPEPAQTWGTGDSAAEKYAQVVDMHECRNVDQLRRFVERLVR